MEEQTIERIIGNTKLSIFRGDIIEQTTEAIVNAANSSLMGGGGVDGAIHRAGGPAILDECRHIVARQGRLPTGEVVITGGGNLKARFVIHTVGPVWHGGNCGEDELLANAYRESLRVAVENGVQSISFPSISTGAYGYPVERAARVAINTMISFMKEDDRLTEVVVVLFDERTLRSYITALEEIEIT